MARKKWKHSHWLTDVASCADKCTPPSPPTKPEVLAVSDTEVALSWKQGASPGSAPILYYLVEYIRPELETEWTAIKEQIKTESMVIKGLIPDTQYQFAIQAVNMHGASSHSELNDPVKTLRESQMLRL
ncbi:UNVERIFIED_CONTAM: hypothetical protein FKN15_067499 [Acipenser sinensis]